MRLREVESSANARSPASLARTIERIVRGGVLLQRRIKQRLGQRGARIAIGPGGGAAVHRCGLVDAASGEQRAHVAEPDRDDLIGNRALIRRIHRGRVGLHGVLA